MVSPHRKNGNVLQIFRYLHQTTTLVFTITCAIKATEFHVYSTIISKNSSFGYLIYISAGLHSWPAEIYNMHQKANSDNTGTIEMKSGSFDCEYDGEPNCVSLVAIAEIFVVQNDFFHEVIPFDQVYLGSAVLWHKITFRSCGFGVWLGLVHQTTSWDTAFLYHNHGIFWKAKPCYIGHAAGTDQLKSYSTMVILTACYFQANRPVRGILTVFPNVIYKILCHSLYCSAALRFITL